MTEKAKILIAGCVKGEKAAWDALVLQYSKLAYSTIRSTVTLDHSLPQDDILEDLHQDFFLASVKMILGSSASSRANEVAAWRVGSE